MKIKPHRLYHGNCLKLMDKIPDSKIDLVVVDPPYGTTSIEWDKILPFDKLWQHYDRIVRPGGVVIIFGNMPFTAHVVLSNPKWYKQTLIWNKNKCGSPGLAKIRPQQVHEDMVVFAKPGKRYAYNPQMTKGDPYRRKKVENPRCNSHGYGFSGKKGEINNVGTRYPTSIVSISRDFSAQQQIHPTQKPVPLFEWLIRTYSNEGDWVLDNTMGSGSAGVACVRTGRKFVGMEKLDTEAEPYFSIARSRIEEECRKAIKSLFR